MLQSEFDRLTSRPYTEAEFSEIHYIYCYHPAVQSKKDIADLWTIGGICLIKDMWPTARRRSRGGLPTQRETAMHEIKPIIDPLPREELLRELTK